MNFDRMENVKVLDTLSQIVVGIQGMDESESSDAYGQIYIESVDKNGHREFIVICDHASTETYYLHDSFIKGTPSYNFAQKMLDDVHVNAHAYYVSIKGENSGDEAIGDIIEFDLLSLRGYLKQNASDMECVQYMFSNSEHTLKVPLEVHCNSLKDIVRLNNYSITDVKFIPESPESHQNSINTFIQYITEASAHTHIESYLLKLSDVQIQNEAANVLSALFCLDAPNFGIKEYSVECPQSIAGKDNTEKLIANLPINAEIRKIRGREGVFMVFDEQNKRHCDMLVKLPYDFQEKKRFRDADGDFELHSIPIGEQLADEATDYYKHGQIYFYRGDIYRCETDQTQNTLGSSHHFIFKNGENAPLYIPGSEMGMSLPDVAEYGSEIISVNDARYHYFRLWLQNDPEILRQQKALPKPYKQKVIAKPKKKPRDRDSR